MTLRRSPLQYATAVVGFGVLVNALAAFFLFAYPQQFLPEAAQQGYLDVWFHPIATVGGSITYYGIPLFAAIGGLHFARADRANVRETLVWFAVAGAAFGIAVAVLGWAITHPQLRPSTLTYAGHATRVAGQFVGATVVGALVGLLLAGRRRGSEVRVPENAHD